MKRARHRWTLLIALSLLTAAVALVGSSTGLASEPAEPRQVHDEEAPRNLTLFGQVMDAETGEPVADAEIRISNLWMDEDGDKRGRDVLNVATGGDGSYSVNVSRGQIGLNVDHSDHQLARADFEIEDDLELDVPLEPVSDERARVEGTVTNEEGDPVEEAHVRLSWAPVGCEDDERHDDCERRHHSARSSEGSAREVQTEQGAIEITYEPREDRYVRAQTDAEGAYTAHVPEGTYEIRVDAEGHLSAQTSLEADANETQRADVTLTSIPPASVTVEGQIVDQGTGEGIEAAEIRLDNQKWGTRNTTLADEEGNFQLAIEPGYTTIQIRAGESYYVPCEEPDRAHTTTASGRNVSSSSEHDDGARPAKSCEPRQQRDTAYMPVSTTIQPDADATIQLDEALKPEPEPDTHLEGWVTNASSGEGVADATIYVSNEETNEWGRAETGEDGSFRIALDEGYYTVRVRAEGYFANATNLEVDGEQRITLSLTPGEPADRRYHAVAHDEVASEAEDGGDDGVATRDTAAASSSPDGEEAYAGGPAELGSPPTSVSGQQAGQPVPSASVLGLVGGLAAAAVLGAALGRVRTHR